MGAALCAADAACVYWCNPTEHDLDVDRLVSLDGESYDLLPSDTKHITAEGRKVKARGSRLAQLRLAQLPLPCTPPGAASPAGGDANSVGCRVAIFSEEDDEWFHGSVEGYDAIAGKHWVAYDDGETEQIRLHEQRYRWLTPDTPEEWAGMVLERGVERRGRSPSGSHDYEHETERGLKAGRTGSGDAAAQDGDNRGRSPSRSHDGERGGEAGRAGPGDAAQDGDNNADDDGGANNTIDDGSTLCSPPCGQEGGDEVRGGGAEGEEDVRFDCDVDDEGEGETEDVWLRRRSSIVQAEKEDVLEHAAADLVNPAKDGACSDSPTTTTGRPPTTTTGLDPSPPLCPLSALRRLNGYSTRDADRVRVLLRRHSSFVEAEAIEDTEEEADKTKGEPLETSGTKREEDEGQEGGGQEMGDKKNIQGIEDVSQVSETADDSDSVSEDTSVLSLEREETEALKAGVGEGEIGGGGSGGANADVQDAVSAGAEVDVIRIVNEL